MNNEHDHPGLIVSSLDQCRHINEELRKENAELAEKYDQLLDDLERYRIAIEKLKLALDENVNLIHDRYKDELGE